MSQAKQPNSRAVTRLQLSILMILVGAGIYVRYIDLDSQFTHVDDIGVARSILEQSELYDIKYIRGRIYDSSHSAFNSFPYQILRKLDTENWLEPSLPLFKQFLKAIIIPAVWTYAPFQFPITSLLISHDQSYKEVLFWGRFPSFLFGSFALIAILLVHKKLHKENYYLTAFFSLLFLSFSWENIIYAKHMSSYSIGVFAAIALLFALIEVVEKDNPTIKFSVILGITLATISHMQYQVLLFMPAFYLAWRTTSNAIIDNGRITYNRLSNLEPLFITALTHVLLTVPMIVLFLLHRTDRGISWSGFFSFPILFDLSQQSTFVEKITYFLHFFSSNFYKIIELLFALSPAGGNNFFVNVVLITAMAAGLYRLVTSSSKAEKTIGRFFFLSILSILVFIVLQKLTFGPTRHSLIFLPYMAVCISFGLKTFVEFLSQRMPTSRAEMLTTSVIATGVILAFIIHLGPALKERKDLFVESEFKDLITNYGPDFVVDQSARNLMFMEPVKDWPRQYSPGMRQFTLFKNPTQKSTGVYMLVSIYPITQQDLTRMKNDFQFTVDFDSLNAAETIYKREENTGACIDVCVERRTGENGVFILILSKS